MIKKYDKNHNLIYKKWPDDYEVWKKYDENNNRIHYKNSDGGEGWYKYDKNNKEIEITHQEFKQIERNKEKRKLYFNNKRINRFSLMDI